MKGLLVKDFYMIWKYCRLYMFIAVAFLAGSLCMENNMFFVFYPCILCGMIPVSLISYDENSRWLTYSGTLPYTRRQIVSEKYLIGLIFQGIFFAITAVSHGIKAYVSDTFTAKDLLALLLMLLIISPLSSSIPLPFIFKLGAEKGRTAYFVMMGCICGASVFATSFLNSDLTIEIGSGIFLAVLALLSISAYVLSWVMSVSFFNNRDL